MHEIAENGVAAHWDYKDPDLSKRTIKTRWIQELVGILDEEAGADEFLENTKMDLYHDHVFCFTPRGDLIALPKGATAVDFAYAVHSKIGENAVVSESTVKTANWRPSWKMAIKLILSPPAMLGRAPNGRVLLKLVERVLGSGGRCGPNVWSNLV